MPKCKRKSRHLKIKTKENVTIEIEENLNFLEDPTLYFLKVVSFENHYNAQKDNRLKYLATIYKLVSSNIEILPNARIKALTCAFARSDYIMGHSLLNLKKLFSVVEIHRAIVKLDSTRYHKQLSAKLVALKTAKELGNLVVKDSTLKRYENKIHALEGQILTFPSSVSGALSRHIRKWARKLSRQELIFMSQNFDLKIWKELADIVHFNPEIDFPEYPDFLKICYKHDEKIPVDNDSNQIIESTAQMNLNEANINEILATEGLPYHKVSKFREHLNDNSKANISKFEDTVYRVVWWYDELKCPAVDQVILERLRNEPNIQLSYAKLLERLMNLKMSNSTPLFYQELLAKAELKLQQYSNNLDGPIVIFADASSSMEVAIKTATIISSFLTVFTGSQNLDFFNNEAWKVEQIPQNISDVIELARVTRASGSTSPAAALWPYYDKKIVLKTIIIVTDEEENTNCHNYRFSKLFQLYLNEISPNCKLIFISFLGSQHSKGEMVTELSRLGIVSPTVQQHVLSRQRPDITKLDSIIGRLSLNNAAFNETLVDTEKLFEQQLNNIPELFRQLQQ